MGEIKFECPICGSKSFTTNTQIKKMQKPYSLVPNDTEERPIAIGGHTCDGCSVNFDDPKKFSKNRQ